jgi:BASS family bile acid:Na+ symporter
MLIMPEGFPPERSFFNALLKQSSWKKSILDIVTNMFPLWVLSFSVLGFRQPQLFNWFQPYITPALTLTMIGMGMTLSVSDFKKVLQSWQFVLVGFLAQYSIMPLTAVLCAKIFHLGPDLASGLILVGCAPGGTASNLVTMIAKADLALSILMTAASTIAAVVMTPLLITKLGGSIVKINPAYLVNSTLNVVLLPVFLGLVFNTKLPKLCSKLSTITPFLSVLLVALICGSVSAVNGNIFAKMNSFNLIAAIATLHLAGFFVEYVFAKLFRASEQQARTIR